MVWQEPKTWSADLVLAADDVYSDGWVRGRRNLPRGLESLSVGDVARMILPFEDVLYELVRGEPYADSKITVGELAYLFSRNPNAVAEYKLEDAYAPHIEFAISDIRGVATEPYSALAWALLYFHVGGVSLDAVEGEVTEMYGREVKFDQAVPYIVNGITNPAIIADAVEYDIDPVMAKFLPPRD